MASSTVPAQARNGARLSYRIEFTRAPVAEDLQVLEQGLREAAEVDWLQRAYDPLAFFARDGLGAMAGGVLGNTGGPWLYVSALWVAADLRGQGLGTKLMDAAEAEGMARGCSGAYLDTFSQLALEFYRRRGYVHFGQLDAGGPHPVRHFLRCRLAAAGVEPS